MGKATTGLKAGIVAGLVYGVIDGVISYMALIFFKNTVMAALQKEAATLNAIPGISTSAQALYNTAMTTAFAFSIVGGIIGGLILGAIFGAVSSKIPGRSAPVKGMVFGFILWIILDVVLDYGDISTYSMNYYLFIIGGGIIAALVYGYIIGVLFGKWDVPPPAPVEELQSFP